LYGQAFAIYGLAAYAHAFHDGAARLRAFDLFELIDLRARDRPNGGYHEAFTEKWVPARGDSSLGPPGFKTMNTHIHLLESFTELYRATGDSLVRDRVNELLGLCVQKIVDCKMGSARLYFTDKWKPVGPKTSSYGHDIEMSWLMTESAQVLGRSEDETVRSAVLTLVEHTLRDGFDRERGGGYYEGPSAGPAADKKTVWWVQAEMLVGLLNAFQVTGNPEYQERFLQQAKFVRDFMFDREYGEWLHTIGLEGTIPGEKAGEWRDPYHQGRACLEIVKRVESMTR
jgi:mannobiose 2-epimerase